MPAVQTRYGKAIRLASTLNQSREDWLRIRELGIGSSDAAVAIGLSPYKSPLTLWLEKTHRKTPDDLSEKEAVIWGTVLEPVLANVYAERTGNKVRKVNAVLQSAAHPFMLANLDREVVGVGPAADSNSSAATASLGCRAVSGVGVLEIKTAGYHSAPQWEDGVPVAYQCQVLHQLAVTGHAWADVAVLIGGQDFRIYRIERDDEKIADLIEREAQFWHQVQHDIQPAPDGSADAATALHWLFPRDDGQTVDLTDSVAFNTTFAELLLARACREEAEATEALLKQQIQNVLGNATTAVCSGGRVSWKRAKDSITTDMERLFSDHPHLREQYARPAPGVRRFTVKPASVPTSEQRNS